MLMGITIKHFSVAWFFIQNLVHRKLGGQIVMQLIMLFAWVLLYIGISSLPYSLRNLLVAEELVA